MNLKTLAPPRPKVPFAKKAPSTQKLSEQSAEQVDPRQEENSCDPGNEHDGDDSNEPVFVADGQVPSSPFADYSGYGEEEYSSVFVDDNPLAAVRMEKVAFVPFSGELGEKLKTLCADEDDDEVTLKGLTGARLKLKLIEKHNMNKTIDLDSLEANDAAWYKQYMENQQKAKPIEGSNPMRSLSAAKKEQAKKEETQENEIEKPAESDLDVVALLLQTRNELAEYRKKVAALEAERAAQSSQSKSKASPGQESIRKPLGRRAAKSSGYSEALIEGISNYRSNHIEVDVSVHEAASSNDVETLEDVLVAFPKAVCSVDTEGRTALHITCLKGKDALDATKLLIQYDANVNAQDADGQTALHMCSDPAFVRLLCSSGADPNISDNNGFTPLHIQLMLGRLGVVQYLLIHSADPRLKDLRRSRNALHYAATMGSFSLFSAVLGESQVPINVDDQDSDGNTVMHLLAATRADRHQGLAEMTAEGLLPPELVLQKSLIMLLDRGASANIQNKAGRSPLHYICANQCLRSNLATAPFVDLLLGMHADPNTADKDGCTPLMVAVVFGDYEVTTLLVSAGGDLNVPCRLTSHYLHNPSGILEENGMMDNEGRSAQDDVAQFVEATATCTPSDIVPCTEQLQRKLFSAISGSQTKVPVGARFRCMQCKKKIADKPPPPPSPPVRSEKSSSNLPNLANLATSLEVLKPGPKVSAFFQSMGINVDFGAPGVSPAASPSAQPTHSRNNSGSTSNDISSLVQGIECIDSQQPAVLHIPGLAAISTKETFGNCAHCGRLLCIECLPGTLLGCLMPSFLQHRDDIKGPDGKGSISVPLCAVCVEILVKSDDIVS